MKVLIDGLEEFYSPNLRLVKTLMKRESSGEYPEPMKWALQMLYFDGSDWIEICRIDNYPHGNQAGSHIHLYGKCEAKRERMEFKDAERLIKKLSARILMEKFNEYALFGDY
jgi:hypothetical protein